MVDIKSMISKATPMDNKLAMIIVRVKRRQAPSLEPPSTTSKGTSIQLQINGLTKPWN
jgi:hypothetical protein